ncbi:uncharacterized protein BO97DRAFT_455191 [Aspergillus homomorphus CBS 101889]|uniref:F-box domain-containing protein n=1 Tax=Aspergillus homomorphus (strain CBS 101889) TaxID=1450537 RepID=A0A395HTB0_ASPHC|nr:hypothetical protein BO97DRAFT_455191 [Aspergillus homomorphus CBS 101889]RAL10729.1 hypothetical protein BO97DRAFT_455191 [Aspergillus homomorphus CBS 101889]
MASASILNHVAPEDREEMERLKGIYYNGCRGCFNFPSEGVVSMQSCSHDKGLLPPEIYLEFAQHMDNRTLVSFSQTCKFLRSMLRSMLYSRKAIQSALVRVRLKLYKELLELPPAPEEIYLQDFPYPDPQEGSLPLRHFISRAVGRGHLHLVARYISLGLDPNVRSLGGWSLLPAALIYDQLDMVPVLLGHPDIDLELQFREDPYVSDGHLPLLNLILCYGRDRTGGLLDPVVRMLILSRGARLVYPDVAFAYISSSPDRLELLRLALDNDANFEALRPLDLARDAAKHAACQPDPRYLEMVIITFPWVMDWFTCPNIPDSLQSRYNPLVEAHEQRDWDQLLKLLEEYLLLPFYFLKLGHYSKACWPNGKALDYESRDCRFEPCCGEDEGSSTGWPRTPVPVLDAMSGATGRARITGRQH